VTPHVLQQDLGQRRRRPRYVTSGLPVIRSSNFPEVNSGEVRGREAPMQPAHAFALLEVCPPDYSNDVGWREIIGERSDREVLPLRKSHGTSRFDVSIGANPLHTATRRAR
jgi:hypothetical protein